MTKTRRTFTDGFKREAVSLLEASGRPLMQVASERSWVSSPRCCATGGPRCTGRGRRRPLRPGPARRRGPRAVGGARGDPPPAEGARARADGARHFKKGHRHLLGPAAMRFRFVEDHREAFPVRAMCAALEVSASGYYAWRGRPESARAAADRGLLPEIRRVHAESRRRYGSPRVHAALRAEGVRVGRHRVARLMRSHGIRAAAPLRFRRTTDSRHALPVAPNLLARRFAAPAPNRVWLADISYVATREGWLYLAVVLDLFSRKVVG